jgi:nucleoside 2-deoxyribosyltransferase
VKLYLAASYPTRFQQRKVRDELARHGHEVTSRWIDYDFEAEDAPEPREHYGRTDLADIDAADVVVVSTYVQSSSGGLWAELGYALGTKKPIILIGPEYNPFCYLANVRVVSTSELPRLLAFPEKVGIER